MYAVTSRIKTRNFNVFLIAANSLMSQQQRVIGTSGHGMDYQPSGRGCVPFKVSLHFSACLSRIDFIGFV